MTKKSRDRAIANMRAQIRALSDQLEYLAKLTVEDWQSGPESSREEFSPRLFGGDCRTGRLAAANITLYSDPLLNFMLRRGAPASG